MIGLRADGRWGGAATQRPLPAARDEVLGLPVATRARLASIWLSQAATEKRVARSFAVIHGSLASLGADPALVTLADRAVDDEHRHAALCTQMAERYTGGDPGPATTLPEQRPRHAAARTDALRDSLFVVGQCALNETFASAYLSAARKGATSPLARAALRELLEDEIDHARIGWAYLSTAPSDLRREISDWLVPLTVQNLREWRRLGLPDDDSLAMHGVPPSEVAQAALTDAVESLLVPGFRHVGLDTRALERWVAAGARVDSAP